MFFYLIKMKLKNRRWKRIFLNISYLEKKRLEEEKKRLEEEKVNEKKNKRKKEICDLFLKEIINKINIGKKYNRPYIAFRIITRGSIITISFLSRDDEWEENEEVDARIEEELEKNLHLDNIRKILPWFNEQTMTINLNEKNFNLSEEYDKYYEEIEEDNKNITEYDINNNYNKINVDKKKEIYFSGEPFDSIINDHLYDDDVDSYSVYFDYESEKMFKYIKFLFS